MQRDFAVPIIVRCDCRERDRQLLEAIGHGLRPEQVEEPFAVDQSGVAEAAHEIGELADTAIEQARDHSRPIAEGRQHMLAQFQAGEPGGEGRADDRADRAAGDARGPQAEFVKGLQHGDMAQAAGAAGPEHERDLGRVPGLRGLGGAGARHAQCSRGSVQAEACARNGFSAVSVACGFSSGRKCPLSIA